MFISHEQLEVRQFFFLAVATFSQSWVVQPYSTSSAVHVVCMSLSVPTKFIAALTVKVQQYWKCSSYSESAAKFAVPTIIIIMSDGTHVF